MGMSTHVVGYTPPDARWQAMADLYDACKKAKVEVPEEVMAFFNYGPPDSAGVEVDLRKVVTVWKDDYREGFELEVAKIPSSVKTIRFYNSW